MDLFHSDMIFQRHKVHVGVVRHHSRHLVSEARSPGKVSAVSTKGVKPSEKNIGPTEVSNLEIHLPKVDLRKAEREEDIGTPLPQEEEITQNVLQTEERDELNNTAVLAEQVMEEKRDKSVRRRFLNWLNEYIHGHIMRKVARTYRRELEEGDDIYKTSVIARWPLMTRAEREQQKRQELLHQDKQRQSVKKLLDGYWEVQRCLKEALRLKEEERYEKWAAEHGASVPASSPEQPKKRMSKWEKRFLRVKEFFSRETIFNETVPACQAL
ncbi:uncharacterized protein LOC119494541 [Sebastes umbrosus]|uniref:uncharacterized protein LOC119494541 n=1 Tax=Sebastes umbrosus TaxID=72105 RepID=UPI00189F540A|nr:uncharacterized protein LOC119494541 [Sebastes umbrosus]